MAETPIYDFIKDYTSQNYIRAHMPGHKGKARFDEYGISQAEPYDITEIKGADSLYDTNGIILKSEQNAAGLFGSGRTVYSAGGSTLCIQTMLALTCKEGNTVAAARNSHISFLNSCILLGLEIKWIYPDYNSNSLLSGTITPEKTENILNANDKIKCVFITSPDYLGKLADVKGISAVCRKHGVKLLVDNAHGAYLNFLEKPCHPINLGADICCDSAHKTLPVLTGGAYLHFADYEASLRAKDIMSLFGSSSPSYLILQSLDLCNGYLDTDFRSDLRRVCRSIENMKRQLAGKYTVCESEPLKLVIYTPPCGVKGYELADLLRVNRIEPEYSDDTHLLFMFSASDADSDLDYIYKTLSSFDLPYDDNCRNKEVYFPEPEAVMSVREAFFAESEEIPAGGCAGRICAKTRTVCPPCVPVAVSGERFFAGYEKILKMYSIFTVNVVK